MTGRVVRLWRRNRLLLLAFALALGLTLLFAARAILFTVYWADPSHRDQAIAGWMTPRYVAHSWHVPPEVVAEALGLERRQPGKPPTLQSIAAEQGVGVDDLAVRIEAAVARYRDGNR